MGIRLATIPSLLVLLGLILGGCSTSRTAEPVASEISTYDTTFTASISSVERIEKGLANPLRFALKRAEGLKAVQATTDENKPYFIEFRARNALSYGHASVVFGKLKKGKKFDLSDLKDQLQQMQNMGGITGMLDKLPGMGQMAKAAQAQVDTKMFKRMEAIIDSMTPAERRNPDLLNGSRKRRITLGSGTELQDLNRLLKQHKQMQKMMKKMGKKGGMANMMRGMGGMMPPGGPGGRFPGM